MNNLDREAFEKAIDEMPEDVLQYVAQSFAPWNGPQRINDEALVDEDGFEVKFRVSMEDLTNLPKMQQACWEKFNKNPQLNSHVRDVMGTLTGYGFSVESDIEDINDYLYLITYDVRNELYKNIPKYVARSEVEGELFLALTVHEDGFVEIDFLEPKALGPGGDYNSGIHFHPNKAAMPLFYRFRVKDNEGKEQTQVFPSIYLAHFPDLVKNIPKSWKITQELLKTAKSSGTKYKKLGNFKTFIVAWDKGFLTPRNLSHVSTTIEWINHYVNLKKWEIDHKKSSGAYLWVVSLTDAKSLRTWLKMTPEQRKETGLTSRKTPGGTLILPPGVDIKCVNPQLASISEQDTDIMHMITSGLNKPEDMVTGQTKGDTFSGVKASRGPQADRTQDQIAFFERFLRYDFWRSIFILKNKMDTSFKLEHKVYKAVAFIDKKPTFKKVFKPTWELIDFDFPTSEISDLEAKARAYLGVKHPSVVELLGIPRALVAKKLGFGKYITNRLAYETEVDQFPELPSQVMLEQVMEMLSEPAQEGVPGQDNKFKQEKPGKEKPGKEKGEDNVGE